MKFSQKENLKILSNAPLRKTFYKLSVPSSVIVIHVYHIELNDIIKNAKESTR